MPLTLFSSDRNDFPFVTMHPSVTNAQLYQHFWKEGSNVTFVWKLRHYRLTN